MSPAPTGQLLDETRLEEHLIYGSARLGTHRDNPVVRRSVWDGAQQRELPTLLTPKAELERLDVPSRVAKLRAGEILTPSSNYTYTRTYATSPTLPAIPAMTAQHTVVGTGCTNVHRAEDRQGNRLFATIATSQVVNGSTVHTLYLLDRNGDVLWNSQGIRAAANTVTHSCQVPGSPNKHYLFTIGTDGRPYIHLIDLSITAITQGAVVLKNVPLDTDPASVYDRALAVVDDRTAYGRTMLYAVRRQGTDYTLMGLDLEALTQNGGGLLAPLAPPLTGSDQAQQGLLQLRPDGAELAFVTADGPLLLNTLWAPTVTVHRYALSPDHLAASYLGAYDEVDAAIHYLDYAPGTQYLYFVRTGLTFGTATHEVKRLDLATNTADVITGEGGDIRRTKHGDMLVATPAWAYNQGEAFLIKDPNDPAPTFAWDFFSQPDARGEAASGLQPLVYELLPATSTRSLNQKRYELADHLGNVRAVVSDRKLCNNAALPTPPTAYRAEVLNQTDYFPFGMISNATTASGGDHRFGFQGQEKDDEVFGSPGTSLTAEFWQYDTRVGRRWNLDPIFKSFESPYAAFGDNPIYFIDPKGDDWYENNNYDPKKKDSKQYQWFKGSGGQDGFTHLGEYLVTGDKEANTLTIHFQDQWTKSIDLGSDEGAKFRMLVAEGGFVSKKAYGKDNTGRGVNTDPRHGGHRETYYGLLIMSASMDNRKRVAGYDENDGLIKGGTFGNGNNYASMFTKSQYNGVMDKPYTNFWSWSGGLRAAGISKKDEFSLLGDVFRAMDKPALQLLSIDYRIPAYSILAYSHNGSGGLLMNAASVRFDPTKTLITNVETRTDLLINE